MKKLLMASAMLAVAAPAFAQTVSSNAGVMANSATMSSASVGKGGGLVVDGTVAGNTAQVQAGAIAQNGQAGFLFVPAKPATANTAVNEKQIGGTVSAGLAFGSGKGTTGGNQNVVLSGGAFAHAH